MIEKCKMILLSARTTPFTGHMRMAFEDDNAEHSLLYGNTFSLLKVAWGIVEDMDLK